MKSTKLLHGCVGILALVLVASAPQAAEWYAGGSIGEMKVSGLSLSLLDDGSGLTGSVDDSDTGWTVLGGVRLQKHFAIEADYIDFGEFSINATSDGTGSIFAAGPVAAEISATGFSVSALGLMPVSDHFDLFARIGYFSIDADSSVTNSATGRITDSDDDDDFYFGAGAQYNFRAPVSLRLEWRQYRGPEDVDYLSIAGFFRFGGN